MARKTLIIEPRGGLCNRMRVVESAVRFARAEGMTLRMVWRVEEVLGCRFGELFQPIDGIEQVRHLRRFRRSPRDWPWLKHKLGLWPSQPVLVEKQVAGLWRKGADFSSLMGRRGAYMRTWSRFYEAWEPHAPSEFFVPVPLLQARIDEVTRGFGNVIGVHIRRGDHRPSRQYSPTWMFVEWLRDELDRAPEAQIFLATDDPETETELRGEFGDAILSRPKSSLDRSEAEAQCDALVDLYCLAATSKVIGSFASSFSRTAADLGRIPRETLSLHRGEPLVW